MFGPVNAAFLGMVIYRKSQDKPKTFLATWYSTRTSDTALGTGVAHAVDAAEGFVGEHVINYFEPNGELAGGPYNLSIRVVGEVREMVWTQNGAEIFRGVGIETGDQLVATYWLVYVPDA
jgi:hypothetical protein